MKIWFLISDEARMKLAKFYLELAGYPYIPPVDDYKPVTFSVQIEPIEGIEKLMKKRPRERIKC